MVNQNTKIHLRTATIPLKNLKLVNPYTKIYFRTATIPL
jgi:hypothetical protein